MILELPAYQVPSLTQRAADCARAGTVVPQDRGHRDHGDLRRDVVAERVSEGRRRPSRPSRFACRRPRRASRRTQADALTAQAESLESRAQLRRQHRRPRRPVHPAGVRAARLRLAADRRACSPASSRARCSCRRWRCLSGAGDDEDGIISGVRTMTRDDGRPVLTPATAASTLVFFVLAMQCLPTLAVTRRETQFLAVSRVPARGHVRSGVHWRVRRVSSVSRRRRTVAMSLLIQDSLVTLISVGAAALLIQRVFSIVRPRAVSRQCAACSHCVPSAASPRTTPEPRRQRRHNPRPQAFPCGAWPVIPRPAREERHTATVVTRSRTLGGVRDDRPEVTWAAGVCAGVHAAGSRHVVYVPDNPLSHVLRILATTTPKSARRRRRAKKKRSASPRGSISAARGRR